MSAVGGIKNKESLCRRVSPHAVADKGRSAEYNGARVRSSCVNDTVLRSSLDAALSPQTLLCRLRLRRRFRRIVMPAYVFAFARTRLPVSIDFLVISASSRSSGIIAARLFEKSVDGVAGNR